MFEYFPENYNWSLAVGLALGMGGEMSEIEDACSRVKHLAANEDETALTAWFEAWSSITQRMTALAEADLAAGHRRSAARKFQRAAAYGLVAERMMTNLSPLKMEAYTEALRALRLSIELVGGAVEHVEVPFEGVSLPALFVPAEGVEGPAPCLIVLNGYDVTKEIVYLKTRDALAVRGVSTLFVDQPGSGGALRLHDLKLRPDTEVPVAACIDFLEGRADVDSERIGVAGISMGGYYAPRAASMEPRLKACVAWGALHSLRHAAENAARNNAQSAPNFQAPWVLGTAVPEEQLAIVDQIDLTKVIGNLTCPLLVVHGAGDRLVPVEQAHWTVDQATSAKSAEVKLFGPDDWGDQHCQHDDVSLAVDYIADWVAAVL